MERLFEMIMSDKPSERIKENEEYIFSLIPSLKLCKGFNQNNFWHIYDVYEHILHVVDGVPSNLVLRLAALFHDVGKPYMYTEDENGRGHFMNHWVKSQEIFLDFSQQHLLDEELVKKVSKLIFYHDLNMDTLDEDGLKELIHVFDKEEIMLLFQLKRSDLLAQNQQFHYLLEHYEEQKQKVLSMKNVS